MLCLFYRCELTRCLRVLSLAGQRRIQVLRIVHSTSAVETFAFYLLLKLGRERCGALKEDAWQGSQGCIIVCVCDTHPAPIEDHRIAAGGGVCLVIHRCPDLVE